MKKKIYVFGNLNVDYFIPAEHFCEGQIKFKPEPKIGGTAYNAAVAFKAKGLNPIIIGKIGKDKNGRIIKVDLDNKKIKNILTVEKIKETGSCHIIYSNRPRHRYRYLVRNANDANLLEYEFLAEILRTKKIKSGDILFIPTHFMKDNSVNDIKNIFNLLVKNNYHIILDIVPHDIYNLISFKDFCEIINKKVNVIIVERKTLINFFQGESITKNHNKLDLNVFLKYLCANIFVIRSGFENISKQDIWKKDEFGKYTIIESIDETGYTEIMDQELKKGFGDYLTAELLKRYSDEMFKQ